MNFAGGGALVKDRLWVNGSVRRWIINKLVNAKNDDGTQAIDDNTLKNYSGKGVFSASSNQKVSFSYNWNNKIRGHRRDTPPNFVPDIASLVQTNPASSTQAKYTGIHNKTVFESSFSIMKGETDYSYQPNTPATAIRVVDTPADTAKFAAQRNEQQPNSRIQFDNVLSYSKPGMAGDHLFKGGVQFARLYFDDANQILGNMYLNYSSGAPINVQEFNTPTEAVNVDKVFGVFGQDSWSVGAQPDAQPRRPLRSQHRHAAGAVDGRRPLHRGAQHRRVDADQAEPVRVAHRPVLRSVRRRQDRDQGERQPLRPAGRHRSRAQRQPVPVRVADLPLDRSEQGRHRAVERIRHRLQRLPEHDRSATPAPTARAGRTPTSSPRASSAS